MPARRPRRSLPWWARWLHTYVSLLGFGALVFFAITGATLNHASWFEGASVERECAGTLPAAVLAGATEALGGIAIVAWLRDHEHLAGHPESPSVDGDELTFSFRGPGYVADVFVDRRDGSYEVLETRRGWIAVANDLHKGRHTSWQWSLIIDASAVVLTTVGITGIWLLWYVRKVRAKGLLTAAAGSIVLLLAYLIWQ